MAQSPRSIPTIYRSVAQAFRSPLGATSFLRSGGVQFRRGEGAACVTSPRNEDLPVCEHRCSGALPGGPHRSREGERTRPGVVQLRRGEETIVQSPSPLHQDLAVGQQRRRVSFAGDQHRSRIVPSGYGGPGRGQPRHPHQRQGNDNHQLGGQSKRPGNSTLLHDLLPLRDYCRIPLSSREIN